MGDNCLTILDLTSGKQHEFYKWQVNSGKNISLSQIPTNIFVDSDVQKKCFSNSAKIALDNDIVYVEGLVRCCGVYIDHAWNKTKDGLYFGVTIKDITEITECLSIIELDGKNVEEMIHCEGRNTYGPFLERYFDNKVYRMTNKRIRENNKQIAEDEAKGFEHC